MRIIKMLSFAGAAGALALSVAQSQSSAVLASSQALTTVPDTLAGIQFASLSPNRRWVVVSARAGTGLFLSRVGSNRLTRLTSRGFQDRFAVWFPSGDRILFTSDRPDRDGTHAHFGMVLDIDTVHGAARGVPRQVTVDSVYGDIQRSPNGALVAYATAQLPHQIRVIPAEGGVAQTVATTALAVSRLVFSPDSKSLYFTEDSTPATPVYRPNRFALEVVPLERSSSVRTLVRAPHAIAAYGPDPRYVVHLIRAGASPKLRVVIETVAGRTVAEAPAIAATGVMFDGYSSLHGGPWQASGMILRVVPADGGEAHDVTTHGQDYLLGWTPDGRSLLSHRTSPGDSAIVRIPVAGGTAVRLPVQVINWRGMLSDRSVAVWDSLDWSLLASNRDTFPTFATDMRTGKTTVLTRTTVRSSLTGRGGGVGSDWGSIDDGRLLWAERVRDSVVIYAGVPGRGKTRIHAFPASYRFDYHAQIPMVAVNGAMVAWAETRGDSATVFVAASDSAAPRVALRIAHLPQQRIVNLLWSNSGRRLAVSYEQGEQERGALVILDVSADGAARVARRIEMAVSVDLAQWMPDDGSIIAFLWPNTNDPPTLDRISVSGGSMIQLASGAGLNCCVSEALSPDGKFVAYTIGTAAGQMVLYDMNIGRLLTGR